MKLQIPILLVFSALLSAQTLPPGVAVGNHRDARLRGGLANTEWDAGIPMLTPSVLAEISLDSPNATLAGQPYLLALDLITPFSPPRITLPNETNALGLTPLCLPLVNGFSAGPSFAGFSGLLSGPGEMLSFVAPTLNASTRVIFQAAAADATAPNGIAITPVKGFDSFRMPTLTTLTQPTQVLAQFGYGLHVADLNQDGQDDVIAGARSADGVIPDSGRVYIFPAGALTPNFILDDPNPLAGSDFGSSTGAGDINGDGFLDIVVGARLWAVGGLIDVGKVVVFLGPTYASTMSISSPSPLAREQFGHWFSCGDFDADGFCDLAVASIGGASMGIPISGLVRIFYGPSLGPHQVLENPSPGLGDRFGYRLEAEDFDHDGFCDLAVAATFKSLMGGGSDDSGAGWVFRGPNLTLVQYMPNPFPSLSGLMGSDIAWEDLNNDGFSDIVYGNELDTSGGLAGQGSLLIYYGPTFANSQYVYSPTPFVNDGFGSAVDIGDFNNDTIPDLLVGAFYYTSPVFHQGRTYVLLGPSYTQAITVTEPIPGSANEFGRRVRAADLDGDGDAEVTIGVPNSSTNGVSRSGAVYYFNF